MLSNPLRTVPPIREALDGPGEDRAFVARLLLSAEPAVGAKLGPDYARLLRGMADRSG